MDRLRLAEICASTSLFTDLGTGQPPEHGLKTCLVAMRLAKALDADFKTQQETFFVSLLRFLGCTADAHEVAAVFGGDDRRFLSTMAPVTMGSPREELTRMMGLVARGQPLPRRMRELVRTLADTDGKARLLEAHCEVASRLSQEMGLPPGVTEALLVAYARWDGRGIPRGLAGGEIPLSVQIAVVARDIELWRRATDVTTTQAMVKERKGRAYAPRVVEAALEVGIDEVRAVGDDLWDVVLALEPKPCMEISGSAARAALGALGDFADLKAPEFAGHARRVGRLVEAAGAAVNFDPTEMETTVRAALVHDLGVVAVPTGIWRAPRRLTSTEWEQVRLHPMWTARMLARCRGLESVAATAGRHHERLDGSGYPAGMAGEQGRGAGLLACAVFFDERTSPRAYRPAQDPAEVADEMTKLAAEGVMDRRSVEAVLAAAGSNRPAILTARPAGLTEREVDVLALLARGNTNRQIANLLGIATKTVGAHVEHIYAKAGVRSRAAATLFAMQNDLLE